MKDHLLAGFTAGLLVWAIVGFVNSSMAKAGEQKRIQIAIPAEFIESSPVAKIDVDEMHCLAKNIYFEARGESNRGKVAVANVTMNRVSSPHYPNTICGVVYQAKHSSWWQQHNGSLVPIRNQCQFSWYCDGKSDTLYLTNKKGDVIKANMQSWLDSLRIAEDSIRGKAPEVVPTDALWYHADFIEPYWSTSYTPVKKVGGHIFYTAS